MSDGWQPIGTGSSRDGHRHLLAGRTQGIWWVMVGFYGPFDGCWFSDAEKPLDDASHWMPLPPPPVTP